MTARPWRRYHGAPQIFLQALTDTPARLGDRRVCQHRSGDRSWCSTDVKHITATAHEDEMRLDCLVAQIVL